MKPYRNPVAWRRKPVSTGGGAQDGPGDPPDRPVTLTLTAKDAVLLERAAFEVTLVAGQAENAFALIGRIVADISGDRENTALPEISDTLQLLARGVASVGERGDIEEVFKLGIALKTAREAS